MIVSMTKQEWRVRRAKLLKGFDAALGRYPDRKPVGFETLAPAVTFNEAQWALLRDPQWKIHGLIDINYVMPEEAVDNPHYRRLRIRYPGILPGRDVTAFLRVPKQINRPVPAVLCLHGHVPGSYFGKEWMDVTARALTMRGFVTLAPDMLPFGERRDLASEPVEFTDGHLSSVFLGERLRYQELAFRGQSLQGVHVWELRRAIDLLQSLPEVNAKRIGVMGHSGGGINTVWLASLDRRIACAVACAGVMSYERLIREDMLTASWNYCPLLKVGDVDQLLSLAAPRPFLGIEGENDRDFDGGYNHDHIYPKVRAVYALYGAADKLAQHIQPGGHDYTAELREVGFAWLEKHLKSK